jgi:hypothetical protein
LSATDAPFEYGSGRIRDVTHLTARKLVKLALWVAREPVGQREVELARQVVAEIETKRHARRTELQRQRRARAGEGRG